jgi:KDO2-lipid IV(A) lauroyltransferase
MDVVLALGAAFGRLWHRVAGPRTRRVRQQLALAFPERDDAWVGRCCEDVFVHLGRGLAELILLRGRHRFALLQRVELEGLEHLEEARRASPTGGVLVMTGHLGNWELAAARAASLGLPISVVYRGLRSPALDEALRRLRGGGRSRSGEDFEQLQMGRAGLAVLRALRRGRFVLVLLDQNARRHEGVSVPFFGRPASTRFGPARIAERLGIPVVPAFIRRLPDGRHHRIRFEPALAIEADPEADDAGRGDARPESEILIRNVARMTAALEARIRETPEQWIWTHRRWRTQPRDERPHETAPAAP